MANDKQDRRVRLEEAIHLLGLKSGNTWHAWNREGRIKIPQYKEGLNVYLRLSDINDVIEGRTTLLYSKAELIARLGDVPDRNRKGQAKADPGAVV